MHYQLVKALYEHFGMGYDGQPRMLDKEESDFRIECMKEEIQEYIDAETQEDKLDALVDLIIFALGTTARHGFDFQEAFERVMLANSQKQVGETKRGYKVDLVKPEYWRAPYLKDLVANNSYASGIVILEGPDGCGKTTLAEYLVEKHGAHYMHSTWSPNIEKHMDEYMRYAEEIAFRVSKRQLVVLDRHWISEVVYADVFRGGSPRAQLHADIHSKFFSATFNNARLVYCLPDPIGKVREHFAELKKEREEMYDNIDQVILAYHALWEGKEHAYTFKADSDYIKSIMAVGGLKNLTASIRYDWTTDGKNLAEFCEELTFPY